MYIRMYVCTYVCAMQNGLLQGPWFIWPKSSFSSDTISNDGRQRKLFYVYVCRQSGATPFKIMALGFYSLYLEKMQENLSSMHFR